MCYMYHDVSMCKLFIGYTLKIKTRVIIYIALFMRGYEACPKEISAYVK